VRSADTARHLLLIIVILIGGGIANFSLL